MFINNKILKICKQNLQNNKIMVITNKWDKNRQTNKKNM